MTNLCCSVNPKYICRNCNKQICADDMKKGRVVNDYHWCESCVSTSEDYIEIIHDLADKVDGIKGHIMDLVGDMSDIDDHVARCRNCRDEQNCSDLYSLIDQGMHGANVAERATRKL